MATVAVLPAPLNFGIYVGATFSLTLTWTVGSPAVPVDLSGYSAALTVKDGQDMVLSMTTGNGRIALGGAAGTIALTVAATDTATLTSGTCNYDLLLTSGAGTVTALAAGLCTIRRGQTV
jgi:hypothetical protein